MPTARSVPVRTHREAPVVRAVMRRYVFQSVGRSRRRRLGLGSLADPQPPRIPDMITLRPSSTLHHVDGGWFRANWHFSFDDYDDPEHTWFGDLRVFNDDTLVPGAVWPMHPHRDVEGITWVAAGSFEHADSLGNGGILPPG